MNMQSKFAVLAILAGFLLGTINLSAIAFAEKPADPDCFGDSSSDLTGAGTTDKEDNEMGEHSREGGVAGDAPFDGTEEEPNDPGREGIGNVGGEGSETHPSDLADALGGDCDVEEEDN
jgi:hypothetical protein